MQCPHCREHFHESWEYAALMRDVEKPWGTGHTACAACKRIIIMIGAVVQDQYGRFIAGRSPLTLVYPKGISRSPLPSEIPAEFATDYREACLVLPDSEKASAALSRRCLQHLLREKAEVKTSDLAKEIQQVLESKRLPGYLAEDLDAIRNIGNFAAHPIKAEHSGEIVEVEPQEAEWLLNLLEGLFDFYFVQPAKAQEKRDALNAKLKSAGKPPMKQG